MNFDIRKIYDENAIIYLPAIYAFMTFIFIDCVFIILHIISVQYFSHGLPSLSLFFSNHKFQIDVEGGYAEFFQYMKWAFVSIAFLYMSYFRKSYLYLLWSFLFLYLFCDDIIGMHEHAGKLLSEHINFDPWFELKIQDVGELFFSLILGFLFFIGFVWGYRKAEYHFKNVTIDMFLLVGVLGFFGVFIDTLHMIAHFAWKINLIFTIGEDGGEMFIGSFMVAYIFFVTYSPKSIDQSCLALQALKYFLKRKI